MRVNTAIVFAWVVFLAAQATGCSNVNAGVNTGSDKEQARLETRGSPGTEFTGSCTIGDGEPTKIGGEVPRGFTYDLEGRTLECEVSSNDSLRVELEGLQGGDVFHLLRVTCKRVCPHCIKEVPYLGDGARLLDCLRPVR